MFENDVEMYGAQTIRSRKWRDKTFENDVEMMVLKPHVDYCMT